MANRSDEYNSLRQELLDHQNRRNSILGLAVTASAALFATGVQLQNPLLPLLALLLLYLARIQIVQTHSAVQRIASYIRIVLEQDNPDLSWETGSYNIRYDAVHNKTKGIPNISPLRPVDLFLLACSLVAIALAFLIALLGPASTSQSTSLWSSTVYFMINGVTALVWITAWAWYGRRVDELEKMIVDKREAKYWKDFKAKVPDIKANPQE